MDSIAALISLKYSSSITIPSPFPKAVRKLNSVKFRITTYGRFLYLVMSLIPILVILLLTVAWGLRDNLSLSAVSIVGIGFLSLWFLNHCIFQMFKVKPRFVLTDTSFIFNGVFVQRIIPWKCILEFHHAYRSSSIDIFYIKFLDITSNKKKHLFIDGHGIAPSSFDLQSEFVRRTSNKSDVINEADIYIALGHKAKAIDVLRKALIADPTRREVKLLLNKIDTHLL